MSSVIAAFFSALALFLVLLCALVLLKELVETITQNGVPALIAIKIFAYQIPGMLVYAFPMAMLLGILLTFSNMSSTSEMVAIRAAGVSFVRIVVPLLSLGIAAMIVTFAISNVFAPYASKRSAELMDEALNKVRKQEVNLTIHGSDEGDPTYIIWSPELDLSTSTLNNVTILYFNEESRPKAMLDADKAVWDEHTEDWLFYGARLTYIDRSSPLYSAEPRSENSLLKINIPELKINRNPEDLYMTNRDPTHYTSDEIREYIRHQREIGGDKKDIGKWSTRLAQRYSLPFTCIVLTLIGAALGLRNHRTSSAIGLGISIIVIFVYYAFAIFISTFGDSGTISPYVAAWLPIVLGTIVGIILVARANT